MDSTGPAPIPQTANNEAARRQRRGHHGDRRRARLSHLAPFVAVAILAWLAGCGGSSASPDASHGSPADGTSYDAAAQQDASAQVDAAASTPDAAALDAGAGAGIDAGPAATLNPALKFMTDAVSYDIQTASATNFLDLQSTVTTWASSGYVVTAAGATVDMNDNITGYAIVGCKPNGSSATFDAKVAQVTTLSALQSTVTGWASSGYLLTAMVGNSGNSEVYSIVGFKPTGSILTWDAKVTQTTDSSTVPTTVTAWASSGYVVTGINAFDSGAGYVVTALGFRPTGSTDTYTLKNDATYGYYGSMGYVLPAVSFSSNSGFQPLLFHRVGSQRYFQVQSSTPTSLSASDLEADGAAGYWVNTIAFAAGFAGGVFSSNWLIYAVNPSY